MKPVVLFVLAGLVTFGVVLAVGGLADTITPGVQAGRAREAAAQAAEAETSARLAAERAVIDAAEYPSRAGALTVAAVLSLVGLGVGATIAAVGVGLAIARGANLRAETISAQSSTGLYPVRYGHDGRVHLVNEPGAQRLAALGAHQRVSAPQLGRLLESPQPMAALPEPEPIPDDLPVRVSLSAWQPNGELVLPCGIGAGGRLVEIPIGRADTALTLVSGLPGSGKSALLHTWERAIRQQSPGGDRCRLAVVDGKRCEFVGIEGSHMWAPVATMPDDIGGLVHRVRAELDRRLDLMARARVRDYRDVGGLFALLLMVDELAVIAHDRAVMDDLTHLGRVGRAAGIGALLSTQRTSAHTLKPELRALADHAISFRVRSQAESRMSLSDSLGAELLPPVPGRGIHKHGELIPFQAFYDAEPVLKPVEPRFFDVEPVDIESQPVQPVDAERVDIESPLPRLAAGEPIPGGLAERIRRQHAAGTSLNRLSFQVYGHKSGSTMAALRDVLEG